MYVLQNLHWFVLLLGALIFFHELGHFVVAKLCRVKVLKFSLGFGPRLFGFRRGETDYVVSALPLGGYVKMLGELPGVEVPPEDEARSFANRPLWQRTAIVLAGPIFNILLAFLVYLVMLVGPQTFPSTRLGVVSPGEPAWEAGLRPGDTIVAIDGKPVTEWEQVRSTISERPGESMQIAFERNGKTDTTVLKPAARAEENLFQETETQGRVGISYTYVKPVIGIVDRESPAAQAGLSTGDEVKTVNGTPVETWYELKVAVAATPSGQPIKLTFVRGGATLTAEVVPGTTAAPAGLAPDLFSSADAPSGYTGLVSREVLVQSIQPDTPAARAGLAVGDRLVGLRTERPGGAVVERPIGVWTVDLAAFSGVDAHSNFVLAYQRGREVVRTPLKLELREEKDELKNVRKEYVFGADNDPEPVLGTYTVTRTVGVPEAVSRAVHRVGMDMSLISLGVAKMIQGRLSFDNMGGPIMLFVIAEKSAKRGAATFFGVLAMISVNLGMLNLLPIPVLDGGHLLFFGMEAVRRRPPSMRVRELANVVGLALLVLLMVLVFKNDILRYVLG